MGKESHGTDSTNDQDNSDRESNPYVVDVPRRERIKKALAEQISNQGSPPTLADFEEETEFTSGVVQSEFGTWSKAVEAAGGNPKPVSNKKSDKELLDEIRRLAEEIGHTPTQDEMNEQGAYSATPYHDRFGSWNNAVVAAGFEPNGTKIPEEELLDEIRRLAEEIGHPPSSVEMDEQGAYSAMTYYNRFGSWDDVIKAAGFDSR